MNDHGVEDPSRTEETEHQRERHRCPPWIGRLLASPLRRLVENPTKILGPYVTRGATVIDVGCAMGFHSLELARLVGPTGKVISLDIQQAMLDGLAKRARRKGLEHRIDLRLCTQEGLELDDAESAAELITLFNVVHETSHPRRVLGECAAALAPGGALLIVEPSGHVTDEEFASTIEIVRSLDLTEGDPPRIWRSHTAVFSRPVAPDTAPV